MHGNLPKTYKRHDLLMILLNLNIQYYYDFILGATNCVDLRKQILDQDNKYPQNFRGFPQSLQTNDWKVSQTGIRPLPFTSFLLLYSLVFLLFELIQSVKKRLQTLRKVGSTHLNKRQSIYVITSIPSKIRTDKCPDTTVDSRHQHRFSINVWVGIL